MRQPPTRRARASTDDAGPADRVVRRESCSQAMASSSRVTVMDRSSAITLVMVSSSVNPVRDIEPGTQQFALNPRINLALTRDGHPQPCFGRPTLEVVVYAQTIAFDDDRA